MKITQNVAFEFWQLSPIFVLLKLTCLVTLFDRKLQIFKNLPKWKRSSLRSQCWIRLFLWFSNTVLRDNFDYLIRYKFFKPKLTTIFVSKRRESKVVMVLVSKTIFKRSHSSTISRETPTELSTLSITKSLELQMED